MTSTERYDEGWNGRQVLTREICCEVDICEEYRPIFEFRRGVQVFLRPCVGVEGIVVEDDCGRLIGWLFEDEYDYVMGVMKRFLWYQLRFFCWSNHERLPNILVISVRVKMICESREEARWVADHFDRPGLVENPLQISSA